MSQMLKIGANKAPVLLGGAILSLAIIGSLSLLMGFSFGLVPQIIAAVIGLVIAWRFT